MPLATTQADRLHRARETVPHDPEDVLPLIRLQAVDRQNDVALLPQARGELCVVGEAYSQEFLVAGKQVRDGALRDGDAPVAQRLVDLGDAAMLAVAQAADAHDNVETKLVMGQGPSPFFPGR